jgi:hypothetical protein
MLSKFPRLPLSGVPLVWNASFSQLRFPLMICTKLARSIVQRGVYNHPVSAGCIGSRCLLCGFCLRQASAQVELFRRAYLTLLRGHVLIAAMTNFQVKNLVHFRTVSRWMPSTLPDAEVNLEVKKQKKNIATDT